MRLYNSNSLEPARKPCWMLAYNATMNAATNKTVRGIPGQENFYYRGKVHATKPAEPSVPYVSAWVPRERALNLTVIPGDKSVLLAWDALRLGKAGWVEPPRIHIRCGVDPAHQEVIGTLDAAATHFVHKNLVNGKTCQYRVLLRGPTRTREIEDGKARVSFAKVQWGETSRKVKPMAGGEDFAALRLEAFKSEPSPKQQTITVGFLPVFGRLPGVYRMPEDDYVPFVRAVMGRVETRLGRHSKVHLVERKALDALSKEVVLSHSVFGERETALKLGQATVADMLVGGDFRLVNGQLWFQLWLFEVKEKKYHKLQKTSAGFRDPAPFISQVTLGLMGLLGLDVEGDAGVGREERGPPSLPVRVAVLSLGAKDATDDGWGAMVGDLLSVFLCRQAGLTLVERAEIEQSLQELELSQSGLLATERVLQLGKLVSAELIILCSGPAAAGRIRAAVRGVRVASGKILFGMEKVIAKGELESFCRQAASEVGTRLAKGPGDHTIQSIVRRHRAMVHRKTESKFLRSILGEAAEDFLALDLNSIEFRLAALYKARGHLGLEIHSLEKVVDLDDNLPEQMLLLDAYHRGKRFAKALPLAASIEEKTKQSLNTSKYAQGKLMFFYRDAKEGDRLAGMILRLLPWKRDSFQKSQLDVLYPMVGACMQLKTSREKRLALLQAVAKTGLDTPDLSLKCLRMIADEKLSDAQAQALVNVGRMLAWGMGELTAGAQMYLQARKLKKLPASQEMEYALLLKHLGRDTEAQHAGRRAGVQVLPAAKAGELTWTELARKAPRREYRNFPTREWRRRKFQGPGPWHFSTGKDASVAFLLKWLHHPDYLKLESSVLRKRIPRLSSTGGLAGGVSWAQLTDTDLMLFRLWLDFGCKYHNMDKNRAKAEAKDDAPKDKRAIAWASLARQHESLFQLQEALEAYRQAAELSDRKYPRIAHLERALALPPNKRAESMIKQSLVAGEKRRGFRPVYGLTANWKPAPLGRFSLDSALGGALSYAYYGVDSFRSSARAVDGTRAYILNANCTLFALDRKTRNILWICDLPRAGRQNLSVSVTKHTVRLFDSCISIDVAKDSGKILRRKVYWRPRGFGNRRAPNPYEPQARKRDSGAATPSPYVATPEPPAPTFVFGAEAARASLFDRHPLAEDIPDLRVLIRRHGVAPGEAQPSCNYMELARCLLRINTEQSLVLFGQLAKHELRYNNIFSLAKRRVLSWGSHVPLFAAMAEHEQHRYAASYWLGDLLPTPEVKQAWAKILRTTDNLPEVHAKLVCNRNLQLTRAVHQVWVESGRKSTRLKELLGDMGDKEACASFYEEVMKRLHDYRGRGGISAQLAWRAFGSNSAMAKQALTAAAKMNPDERLGMLCALGKTGNKEAIAQLIEEINKSPEKHPRKILRFFSSALRFLPNCPTTRDWCKQWWVENHSRSYVEWHLVHWLQAPRKRSPSYTVINTSPETAPAVLLKLARNPQFRATGRSYDRCLRELAKRGIYSEFDRDSAHIVRDILYGDARARKLLRSQRPRDTVFLDLWWKAEQPLIRKFLASTRREKRGEANKQEQNPTIKAEKNK